MCYIVSLLAPASRRNKLGSTTVHPSTAVTHCSNLMAMPDALVITLTGVL